MYDYTGTNTSTKYIHICTTCSIIIIIYSGTSLIWSQIKVVFLNSEVLLIQELLGTQNEIDESALFIEVSLTQGCPTVCKMCLYVYIPMFDSFPLLSDGPPML